MVEESNKYYYGIDLLNGIYVTGGTGGYSFHNWHEHYSKQKKCYLNPHYHIYVVHQQPISSKDKPCKCGWNDTRETYDNIPSGCYVNKDTTPVLGGGIRIL